MTYYIVIGGFVAICVIAIGYQILYPKEIFMDKKVIDHNEFIVHNSQNQNFKQGANTQFEGYTMNDARLQFNMAIAESPNINKCNLDDTIEIPDEYDWRQTDTGKACSQPVRLNGNCTAGHINAVVSTVEDRMCQQLDGETKFQLSAQDALNCDHTNFYCSGGYVTNTLNYGKEYGFIDESCMPWTGDNTTCPEDPNPCRLNKENYIIADYCAVQGPEEIKAEIIKNGPVIAPLSGFTDFLAYKEGTYFPDEAAFKFNGQNIVKIVGWGSDVQGTHWIVQLAWGEDWGEEGFARVPGGRQELGIDFIGIAPITMPMNYAEYEIQKEKFEELQNASEDFSLDDLDDLGNFEEQEEVTE